MCFVNRVISVVYLLASCYRLFLAGVCFLLCVDGRAFFDQPLLVSLLLLSLLAFLSCFLFHAPSLLFTSSAGTVFAGASSLSLSLPLSSFPSVLFLL